MAKKRMFDKGILETDEFMDMPMQTKALYFLLGMEADDEGFVSPKRVMRLYGGNEDDLKILIAKNFVIQFESGVIVITSWHENNYLDKNKVTETRYQAEKKLVTLSGNRYERLNQGLTISKKGFTQYRIEENSIEENSIEYYSEEDTVIIGGKMPNKAREENIGPNGSVQSTLGAKKRSSIEGDKVNGIIGIFKAVNPSYGRFYANKTQRQAVERLLKLFSEGQLQVIIQKMLPIINADPYAKGKSTSPTELERNIGFIKAYQEGKNNQKNNIVAL